MAKWNISGKDVIAEFAEKAKLEELTNFENIAIREFGRMVEESPVGININGTETGFYKANWQVSSTLNKRVLRSPNKNKGTDYVSSKLKGRFSNMKKSTTVYIFNNSPYARVIEFGGYPSPVKRGTYVRGRGYIKRSSGGYSKQAPGGHVRKAVMRFSRAIK